MRKRRSFLLSDDDNKKVLLSSASTSAHYGPMLDKGLNNFSPSRSIFSYSHPTPASCPAQIVTPLGLRASYTTFTETQSPFQNSFTPSGLLFYNK
jgi:hypothetical protein